MECCGAFHLSEQFEQPSLVRQINLSDLLDEIVCSRSRNLIGVTWMPDKRICLSSQLQLGVPLVPTLSGNQQQSQLTPVAAFGPAQFLVHSHPWQMLAM